MAGAQPSLPLVAQPPSLPGASGVGLSAPEGGSASVERLPSPGVEHYRRAIRDQPLSILDTIVNAAWKDTGRGLLTTDEVADIQSYARARKDQAQARKDQAKAAKLQSQPEASSRSGPSVRTIGQRIAANKANLPCHVAEGFASCGRAILAVIAQVWGTEGACNLRMGEIARKVGCSVESVRLTLREAERRSLINTVHHRLSPMLNAPNEVTVVDQRWRVWIGRGIKGAAKRAGAEARTRAQAVVEAFRRRKDERAAIAAIRAERKAPFLRGAAAAVARSPLVQTNATAFGGNPESLLHNESPSVALQPLDENCPSGSSWSGGSIFNAARLAIQELGLDPRSLGTGPETSEPNSEDTILDGVSYDWS